MPSPLLLPDAPHGLFVDDAGAWYHDGQSVRHARLCALLHRSVARNDAGALVVTTGRDVLPFVAADCPRFVERIELLPDALVLHLMGGVSRPAGGPFLFCPDDRLRVAVGDTYALLLRSAHHVVQSALEATDTGYRAVFSTGPAAPVHLLDAPLDPHSAPSPAHRARGENG